MNRNIIIILTSIIVFMIFLILTEPLLELKGNNKIQILLNESFKDPGFIAKTRLKKNHKKVKVTSDLDIKKVGNYEIKYQFKSFFNTKTLIRNVSVIETEKPKLTLKGNTEISLCPNEKYKEEGYEVEDNYDKDLKNKVKIKRTKDQIIYSIKDSSGNQDIKIRKIIWKNKIGPELSLKGSNVVIIKKNEKYKEEGYEATDTCDGNITSNVIEIGYVDTSKIGIYQKKYIVKNKSGIETIKVRTIIVTDQKNINNGIIYLTFDDGPSNSTSAILDILKNEKIKATFFVTNRNPNLDNLIKREYDDGHSVALHTATHNYSYLYSSKEAYFEDLKTVSNRVKRITNKESKIIRFPGGGSNLVSKKYSDKIMTYLTKEVGNRGYHYYDWNVDSGDATGRYNSEEVYTNVVTSLRPGRENIVLMHDFASNHPTEGALEKIIRYGKENGYIFLPITETTREIHHYINN